MSNRKANRKTLRKLQRSSSLPPGLLPLSHGVNGATSHRPEPLGRNSPCPCQSGKKYKRCCGNPFPPHTPPKRHEPSPELVRASRLTKVSRAATVAVMRSQGVPESSIWGYLQTGYFITEQSRVFQDPQVLAAWDAAIAAYDESDEETRNQFF